MRLCLILAVLWTLSTIAVGDVMAASLEYPLPEQTLTATDRSLYEIMDRYGVVGMAVAVYNRQGIIWSSGYGWADITIQQPVTTKTIFRLASISKMIAATALMQLYEQGAFGLDDDVSPYLGFTLRNPEWPDTSITFRQLMTHTAGINDSGKYDEIVEQSLYLLKMIDLEQLFMPGSMYYDENIFCAWQPGHGFNYSNLGTAIVGSLVEKISGQRFDEYCQQHIFQPLAVDASFNQNDIIDYSNEAELYRYDNEDNLIVSLAGWKGQKPPPRFILSDIGSALGYAPAGNALANVDAVANFMRMHMNRGTLAGQQLLKPETADLMHQMQWYGYGLDGLYKQKGLNFHISDDIVPGARMYGHAAEAYGLVGDAYYDNEHDIGFVFLLNGGHYTGGAIYDVELALASVLYDSVAHKSIDNTLRINAINGQNTIVCNDRLIALPNKQTVADDNHFLPLMTVADICDAEIITDDGEYSLKRGEKSFVVKPGQLAAESDGQEVVTFAPFWCGGQIWIYWPDVTQALGWKVQDNK